jgi:hypothetical protein
MKVDVAYEGLDTVVTTVGKRAPEALVTADALQQVQHVLRHFPASMAHCLHLETRLSRPDPQVDIVFSFRQGTPSGLPLWATRLPEIALLHPCWQGVQAYDRACAEKDSPLHDSIKASWLEFDVPPDHRDVPLPGLFAGIRKDHPMALASVDPSERLEWQICVTQAAMKPLWGQELPSIVSQTLRETLLSLPARARLIYVGAMLPRPTPAIRLCFTDMQHDELFAYLRRVWQGPSSELEQYAIMMSGEEGIGLMGTMRAAMLHLDVWDTVHPRVGLEFIFARKPQIRGRLAEAETGWLSRLVRLGLADPIRAKALAAWPGYRSEVFPHLNHKNPVFRYVNHVKLVYAPDGFETKAYLTFELNCWMRKPSLVSS